MPRGDEHVPRADALELVSDREPVGRRREEREVNERVRPLGREDLREPRLGGRLREVDLVEARLALGGDAAA